jgi:hypothetical protein
VLAYFVQAVDSAGNVGVASDKGAYYAAPPAGSTTGSVAISLSPQLPSSGFFAGPVTATLTDADGSTAPISYTLDGVTTSGVAPGTTVTASGDGVHILSASEAGGAVSTVSIPIDAGPPKILPGVPAAGGIYVLYQPVLASFGCTDGLAVTSCTGLVDGTTSVSPGSPLPTSPVGQHTLVITAVNAAGVQATLAIPYTVTYGICSPLPLSSKVGQPVAIAIYLCGFKGGNQSSGQVTITALSLDGGKVPNNQLTGNTAFLWVPSKLPSNFPPLPFLRIYAYLMKAQTVGQHTLVVTVSGDPIPHQITFTVKA